MQRPDPYNIVESLTIGHDLFERSKRNIIRAIGRADGKRVRRGYAIVGPSGAGKTKLAEECVVEFPDATREAEGIRAPKIFEKVPAKPTPKSLASAILKGLRDPLYTKGAEWEMLVRVHEQMRGARVKVLVLDDIHHFVDQSSGDAIHHAADMLKNIVDEVKCVVILTGLPYTKDILTVNEQIRRRFHRPIELDRFYWDRGKDREEFLDILTSFEVGMKACFKMPSLGTESMGFRFYCASGGIIGYVAKILGYAAQSAADEDRLTLTMKDFDTAYQEAVWEPDSGFLDASPFSGTKPPVITIEQLKAIQKYGEPGVPKRRGNSRSRSKKESVASVLTRK